MTSCFPIMCYTARLVSNNVGVVLKQVVRVCNVFVPGRHAVWLCHHIQYGGEVWCLWLPCWVFRLKFVSYLLDSHYLARLFVHCESAGDVVAVEAEWSASEDVRGSADESILDDLSQWLWDYWWHWWWWTQWQWQWHWQWQWQWRQPPSAPWHVQRCRVSSLHCAVVSLLVLASDSEWLARIPDRSLGQTSAEEAD